MVSTLDSTNRLAALNYNQANIEKLIQLCEPLFSNFNMTIFVYSRFFKNGTYLDLSTNLKWQKYYTEYFAVQPFIIDYIQNIYKNHVDYVLWNNDIGVPREKTFTQFITDSCAFDIWHGFSIYKQREDSLEAWHFGTTKANYNIINFYLNHLDVLHHFITYFQDKASTIIDSSDSTKLIAFKEKPLLFHPENLFDVENHINAYKEQAKISRYGFDTSHGKIYITPREAECLMYLSKSKTVKEIGRILNLSPRTVEEYINNAKRKLGCFSRTQLIDIFNSVQHHHLSDIFKRGEPRNER